MTATSVEPGRWTPATDAELRRRLLGACDDVERALWLGGTDKDALPDQLRAEINRRGVLLEQFTDTLRRLVIAYPPAPALVVGGTKVGDWW